MGLPHITYVLVYMHAEAGILPHVNEICSLIPKAPPTRPSSLHLDHTRDYCLPGPLYVAPKDRPDSLGVGLTQEVPPLGIQVGLVGKAAFEHISAIVRAGPGTRDSPAMSTVDQLHDGPRTFWGQRYLENKGSLSAPCSPRAPAGQLAPRKPNKGAQMREAWDASQNI